MKKRISQPYELFHYLRIGCLILILAGCTETLTGDLIITNVNIINVETGDVLANQDLVINSDTITRITRHSSKYYKAPSIIDGTDKFLIPGLWDMHTHTWWGYKELFPLLLANGVTGIQEMSGNLTQWRSIKEKIKKGLPAPEIITSGAIIDGKPALYSTSDEVDTPEEARHIVRKQIESGADFIKVYSYLKKETYLAIADECNKLGVPFYGHVPDKVPLEEAIAAGHKSLEHFIGVLEYCSSRSDHFYAVQQGSVEDTTLTGKNNFRKLLEFQVSTFDSSKVDKMINLIVKNETWVNPTNVVNRAWAYRQDSIIRNDPRIKYMPHYLTQYWGQEKPRTDRYFNAWKAHYKLSLSLMKRMQNRGVKFLAGTDYGNPDCYPGFSLHDELEIFVQNGFTPLEALQTATLNPAKFLGLMEEFGTVETGKVANLVLLNKNPLESIENTKEIIWVIVRGNPMSSIDLTEQLDSMVSYTAKPRSVDTLLSVINQNGMAAGIDLFTLLKTGNSDSLTIDEYQLEDLAFQLADAKKYDEAIEIAMLNLREYPEFVFAQEDIGDIHLQKGDTTKAIIAYKLAQEILGDRAEKKVNRLEKK